MSMVADGTGAPGMSIVIKLASEWLLIESGMNMALISRSAMHVNSRKMYNFAMVVGMKTLIAFFGMLASIYTCVQVSVGLVLLLID